MTIPDSILDYLYENRDRFVSHEELIKAIWGNKCPPDSRYNSMRAHMVIVREKVKEIGDEVLSATGVKNKGFILLTKIE